MERSLQLIRPRPARNVISLAPMIDVMLILLVFFMVTSTYLNLDTIPAATPAPDSHDATVTTDQSPPLIVTISAAGTASVQGREISIQDLARMLANRVAADPETRVVLLPSGGARMQAMISVLDAVTGAGATRVRIVRFEARP